MIDLTPLTDYSSFHPMSALRTKYILIGSILAVIIWLAPTAFVTAASYFDPTIPYPEPVITALWIGIPTLLIILTAVIAGAYLYYPTIEFQMSEADIIVNRGFITKSHKLVPYRTITNIEIKRGPFDRLLGIGSIEIQTAGFSAGKTGPEEKLDGVAEEHLAELQKILKSKVQQARGSAGTTQDTEYQTSEELLHEILLELRKLREKLSD